MANKTENKKGFKAGTYAVFAGVAVAVVLVLMTIFAFTTRYTAFAPEKVAQSYVDVIVQTGDGYNAYKNTLVSKNMKYGDFIRRAYMAPFVNDGDDVAQAEFVGTGSEDELKAIDTVYNTMYDYYVGLINTYGYDDYDAVFSNYFAKLCEVRHQVYGDDYMDTEYMFGAFEANVDAYGKALTGTDRVIASDNKTITQEATVGKYQEMYGVETEVETENVIDGKKQTVTETKLVYKLTSTVKECDELSADEVKAYVDGYKERITPAVKLGEEKSAALADDAKDAMIGAFESLDNTDAITSVAKAVVEVTTQDGTVVATQELYVVEIGNSWYVDNTNVNTAGLYLAK